MDASSSHECISGRNFEPERERGGGSGTLAEGAAAWSEVAAELQLQLVFVGRYCMEGCISSQSVCTVHLLPVGLPIL